MAKFILKDQRGNEQEFDHDKIFVMGTDGELLQFTQGAGASPDVRYVTFMSYDGLTEYGKKAVAVGDDCADPIARGIFTTPTRESDVQYNYTFYDWATTPNGAADSSWNKAITEDKTVYANFASSVRYYTITYYDSDGTTVLKTESLAYGATPSYTPTKANYVFGGWNPGVTSVTGDATYTVVWEEKVTFATASWAKIAEIAESGNAANYFALGDERDITINVNGKSVSVPFVVVHFGDTECQDGNIAGITLLSKHALPYSYFGGTSFGIGWYNGWSNSDCRTTANNTAINNFPSDVREHIKYVKKLSAPSGNKATSDANEETIDRIWIPSITEYGESWSKTTKNQGFRFSGISKVGTTAYSMNPSGTVGTSKVIHGTRSAHMANGSSFMTTLNESGYAGYGGASYCRMGFCI